MNNNLSILKIVNGLSRTLNIANQMIPLYKQVKPFISNSNKLLNGFKNFNLNRPTINKTPPAHIETHNINSPTFFQ